MAGECLRLREGAVVEEPAGLPAGAGLVWTGGFAFDPHGAASPPWSSFSPASICLPELSLCRQGGEAFLTVNLLVAPGDDAEALASQAESRLAGLREAPLPLLEPHLSARPEIRSVRPPDEFERIVAAATERIGAGDMSKVVLAREIAVEAPAAHDPAAVFGAHVKAGGWRLGLLVARNVEKGSGDGINDRYREGVSRETPSKVSAREFAEQAGTTAARVLRHLEAWDR
ncbi:MAG: hypothetical protein WD404_07505, partial [Solirubrobacterales bacterium]